MVGFRESEDQQWQRTRFGAYMIYCANTETDKRVSIYEFMPLAGDPSEEQQTKIREAEREKDVLRMQEGYEEAKQRGLI